MISVAIIGAGIGGLCTGLGLLLQGYDVSIYEKTDATGGVLRSITSPDGGFRFEESASIPINPNTYHVYLKNLGLTPNAHFSDQLLQTLYDVYYVDGRVLKIPHDINEMRETLQKNFSRDSRGWDRFLLDATKKYQISKNHFITKPFMGLSSILNTNTLGKLLELNPFTSASSYVKGFISAKELQEFILFQGFFMGIAPTRLPNVYTTVYSNSQIEGISHITGGLSQYAQMLTKLFGDKGGKIHYNTPVQKIIGKDSLVTGIRIGSETIKADVVVVNADYCYAQKALLNRPFHRYFKHSCSSFILHLGLTKLYPELNIHTLFINKRFKEEIAAVFKGQLPQNPSLYIYAPSTIDNSYCKNPSHSVVNIMVRVPNLKVLPIAWDENTREEMASLCLKTLSSIKGLENIQDHIVYKQYTAPTDFKNRYNCLHGSCFGIGHTLLQSMALRPQLQDKTYNNLYYVGSSIHPGNGASIVMEGAMMVKEAICQNHPI